jgi:hypothetical protein
LNGTTLPIAAASVCQAIYLRCFSNSSIHTLPNHGYLNISVSSYSAKSHITPDPDSSELLDASRKHRVQEIVGSLLIYPRAVDNKLLVALSAIATRQAKATVAAEQAVDLLLDYVATYPNNGMVYQASVMILCAHADAGFLNKTILAAELVLTSTYWKMILFLDSMVPFSLLPKLSSLSWLWLLNQSYQHYSSLHKK